MMKKAQSTFIIALSFLVLHAWQPSLIAAEAQKRPPFTKKRKCAVALVLAALIPMFALPFSPLVDDKKHFDLAARTTFFHKELAAWWAGTRHIGMGVEFDVENIIALLNAEEKRLLDSPQDNVREIAGMISEKLSGDKSTDSGVSYFNFSMRKASSFFKGQSKKRGICPRKNLILHAFFNYLGIPSEIKCGITNLEGTSKYNEHVWNYIPSEDLIVDPSRDEGPWVYKDANEFYKRVGVKAIY